MLTPQPLAGEPAFADLAHVIELSIAPVFLLVAIGSFLNVMTQRLGRIIDRARDLERLVRSEAPGEERATHIKELVALSARIDYANAAIGLSSIAALFVAVDVALMFASGLIGVDMSAFAALLFIASMVGIIGGLGFFFAEIVVATRSVRVRAEQYLGK